MTPSRTPPSRRSRALAPRASAASPTSAASASPTRSSARARRRCSSSRPGRSSTRASGSCRSPTSPATSASSRSTRAATGAPTAPTRRGYGPRDDGAGRARRARRGRHRTTACSSRHCAPAAAALLLAADHPERVRGAVFMSPALPITPPLPERTGTDFDAVLPDVRGLGEVEPPLLGAGLPRLPRVLLRPLLRRAALDEADRGRDRLGARDDARDARAHDRVARPRRARRSAS